jgi:predicted RNase H-like HicB family nuclease
MEESRAFIAVIRKHAAAEFELRFPDLPYCVVFASTQDEAVAMAAAALADQLDELIENEEAIPAPSTVAEILADPQWAGCLAMRIRAAPHGAAYPVDDVPCADDPNDASDPNV